MIIGLDIDDVIFKTSEALKTILDECEDEEILSHKLDIMRGDAINSKVGQFLKDNGVPAMKKAKPMKNVTESIKKLREQSNKIILITARGNITFPGSEKVTIETLRENEIEYDAIIYNSKDKAEDCRKNNVNLFVDDSPKNCLEVQQKLKIPVIGFESDITREEMIRNNIRSVSTWINLLELINQICSKKDNMEKF